VPSQELRQPFVEQPRDLISDVFQSADNNILAANSYVEKAFLHENTAQQLTNLKAPADQWKAAKTELINAIVLYERSIEKNNKALNLLNSLEKTAKISGLIAQRTLANKLAKISADCHTLTLSFIDYFIDQRMDLLKQIYPEIRACIKERKSLEEQAQKFSQ